MTNNTISAVYSSNSEEGLQHQYDDWANAYEKDNAAMGYKLYSESAAVFAHLVPLDTSPILDAGCGTGVPIETLHRIGYREITGIDISHKMMAVAKAKDIYTKVSYMSLSEPLDFPNNFFSATISSGVVTPGHAPATAYREFLRVTKKGGIIVFSMRCDEKCGVDYKNEIKRLINEGLCSLAMETPDFMSFPFGDTTIRHQIIALRSNS